jgi:hypothetical protein
MLSDAEIWTLSTGLRLTSALRTVIDCARAWEPAWGLAVADAALGLDQDEGRQLPGRPAG